MHPFAAIVAAAVAVAPATPSSSKEKPSEMKVTFDVQAAEVVNVIRLLGDVSGKNIVVADDVKGKVTLKLKNVGWRAALDVVLKANGAAMVEEDNIIWIAPDARVRALEQAELDRAAERELKGPLYTRIIQVNNAIAEDLAVLVKPLLSPRGTVTFDERTNVLIVRDVQGSLALRQGL